jgi:hypothetical protein
MTVCAAHARAVQRISGPGAQRRWKQSLCGGCRWPFPSAMTPLACCAELRLAHGRGAGARDILLMRWWRRRSVHLMISEFFLSFVLFPSASRCSAAYANRRSQASPRRRHHRRGFSNNLYGRSLGTREWILFTSGYFLVFSWYFLVASL